MKSRKIKTYPTDMVLSALRAKLLIESTGMEVLSLSMNEKRNEIRIKISTKEK